jgi:hypothetical protein
MMRKDLQLVLHNSIGMLAEADLGISTLPSISARFPGIRSCFSPVETISVFIQWGVRVAFA